MLFMRVKAIVMHCCWLFCDACTSYNKDNDNNFSLMKYTPPSTKYSIVLLQCSARHVGGSFA